MGSSRLPGKVLADLEGGPVLARVVDRTARARLLSTVVVATSRSPADDVIEELCRSRGWNVYRGSEADVLSRYSEAAVAYDADAVVRVTADDPFTDPAVVDQHVEALFERWGDVDFVTNMATQTFPYGLAVEAMPFDVLARIDRLSQSPEQREHVTSVVYEHPHLFVIADVLAPADYSALRWTVDTADDLERARQIFRHFGNDEFGWEAAVAAFPTAPA